ncbi:hypothetical protein Syun_014875 [Stephania yunnanensis]|uniref:Protein DETOXIFICATION n=1 Tax=Stephania yunnanensis TaxID=152371 RepID=A0AAP0JL09_9MAGN
MEGDHAQPLLTKLQASTEDEKKSVVDEDHVVYQPPDTFLRDVWMETKMVWYIAGPAILTSLFQYSLAFVTQTFVGHLGTLELAAVGLQNLVISGIGFGVMVGMGSALETLCGQAYGAGQLKVLGIYMQRSWVILLTTALILTPVYVFASPILILLGQDTEAADVAGKYSVWMLPQLFAYALNFPVQKFLQAQSKVMAMAWISLAALVVHVGLSWLAIFWLDLGLVGAAVTLNASWCALVVGQVVYVFYRCGDAWTGFSWLAFADLAGFVGLSLASAVMLWAAQKRKTRTGRRFHLPAAVFTDDKLVMAEVSKLACFLSVSIFLCSVQPILSGVAIGAGWQAIVAYVNVGSYYLVGLAVGCILGFKFNFGLEAALVQQRVSTWGKSTEDSSTLYA